jgi:hypothetical protein
MEAKKHFSRRGAEAQRRWCESRYFGIQILEFFFFLKMACLGASSEFHLKNLCASAPLRENFRHSAICLIPAFGEPTSPPWPGDPPRAGSRV